MIRSIDDSFALKALLKDTVLVSYLESQNRILHRHPQLGSPSGKDHQDSWGWEEAERESFIMLLN